MIGCKVVMTSNDNKVGEVMACAMNDRGHWCLLVADSDGKLHATESNAVRMANAPIQFGTPALPQVTHHESTAIAGGGLPGLYPAQVFGEVTKPVTAPAPVVSDGVQKFPAGTRVRRRPSIDPPMPEGIFTVEIYKAHHGMHDKPRYWGRRDVGDPNGEMEGGYEDQLEVLP